MNQSHPVTIDTAKYNLSLVFEMIRFADTKATFLLTLGLGIGGVSLATIPMATRVVYHSFAHPSPVYGAFGVLVIALQVSFYCANAYALYKLGWVVRPRLARKLEAHSWFYFQSMAQLSPSDFLAFTEKLTAETLRAQLIDQVYNNSIVAQEKFRDIRVALSTMLVAGILGLLAVCTVLIAGALIAIPSEPSNQQPKVAHAQLWDHSDDICEVSTRVPGVSDVRYCCKTALLDCGVARLGIETDSVLHAKEPCYVLNEVG